ncbi:ATP-binding protein [Nocardioides pinisoli]|uniref:ATP-binding protein n=1 Tax=Nocardioides pinisoli TaxID=2950279 RepID=A0ABT1KRC1_9ACTN|nr:ATP-binding protein [Nocardioides pinisoli]MCP3420288.1 ATP-binding protein [Nocardioides pinisoli]
MTPAGGDGDRTLVGRAREVAQLDAFVRAATATGGVLLLTAEAGMGKSALEAATGTARRNGARVLRAPGVEFETSTTPTRPAA